MAVLSPSSANHLLSTILISICLLCISSTSSYNITTTIEAPFIQQSSAGFEYVGIETFDTVTTGWHTTYATDFGLGTNSPIKGIYTNLGVVAFDSMGGAGGIGNYALCGSSATIQLDMTQVGIHGLNYFGLWISALDSYNSIEFYFQGSSIFRWDAAEIIGLVQSNPDYYGNPTTTPRVATSEMFVFVNFYFNERQFDRVWITQGVGLTNYESDNHTVGYCSSTTTTTKGTTTTTESPNVGPRIAIIAGIASAGVAAAIAGSLAAYLMSRSSEGLPPSEFDEAPDLMEDTTIPSERRTVCAIATDAVDRHQAYGA